MAELLYSEDQPRDENGQWGEGGGGAEGAGGESSGAGGAADKEMSLFAKKYQDAPIEHGVVIRPDGSVVEQTGSQGMVVTNPKDAPPGSIEIHNHPTEDSTFSPGDISTTLRAQLSEMRVVDAAGNRYTLRNTNETPPSNARISTVVANLNSRAIADATSKIGEATDSNVPEFSAAMRQSLARQYKSGALLKIGLEYEVVSAGSEKASGSGRGERLADMRGTGPTKRRKWEQAVNSYQADLTKAYDDWADSLADDLEAATDEVDAEDILDSALVELSAMLTALGRTNIVAGGSMALGKTIPTPGYLNSLAERIQENEGYIDDSLIPDIRNKINAARMDPDIVATGAPAFLGMLAGFGGRINSYAGGMWSAMQDAQGESAMAAADAGQGGRMGWQRDEQAAHCADCLEYGEDEYPGRIYDSWDAMLAETGDRVPGEVQCDGNCRCSLWVETAPDEWTREGYSADTTGVERLMGIIEKLVASIPPYRS